MMKSMTRNQKGISLITLSITVIVLVIITNVIIYNLQDNLGIERVRNMQNDIENLRDKVDSYYLQYGTIPIINKEYTNIASIDVRGVNDIGKFYIVDLSALENLTLTYGEDYKKITDNIDINTLDDIYIINESSHNIFYVKGITVDGITYYTDYTKEDVDTETVDIRYVNGIKIPDGYKYYKIDDNNFGITDGTNTYQWISVNKKITNLEDLGDSRLAVIDNNTEAAIESINRYGGYYYMPYTVLYIGYNEDEDKGSPTYNEETKYTDKNGDTAIIPKGFQVSRTVGSNTVKEGLVAKDKTGNSYVWIEVPKSIYKSVISSEDYPNIEKDMQDYAKDYREDNYIDADSEEKKNMLKSVYENNGFWVSQYEIGTETKRESSSSELTTPVSKRDMYPYNYVSYGQAKDQAEKMAGETGRTSSLLYGIQWDLMLKFIETNGSKTKDEIKVNSTGWGNYVDSDFYLYRGKYYNTAWNEVTTSHKKGNETSELLTTGATIRNSTLNIYDIAGNVTEWTHEKSSTTPYSSACLRGGYYQINGKESTHPFPAYSHSSAPNSGVAMMAFGFRVTIY